MTLIHIAYLLIILFCLGDAGLTIYIVMNGGTELNPIDAWLGGKIGVTATQIVTKAAIFVAVWYFIKNLWELLAIATAYAGVVAWNAYQASKTAATKAAAQKT